MATPNAAELVSRQMKERLAKRQAENPYTPTKRSMKSTRTPSTAPTADTPTPPAKNLLRTGASPPVTAAESARSLLPILKHPPVRLAPVLLRTVVLTSHAPTQDCQVAKEALNTHFMAVGQPMQKANGDTRLKAHVTTHPPQGSRNREARKRGKHTLL
jgi:hypothetical protein